MRRVVRPVVLLSSAGVALFAIALPAVCLATAAAESSTAPPTAADHDARLDVVTVTVKDASEPYRWVNEGGPYGGHVRDLAIDLANPRVLYACGHGGLYKTADGARTWGRVETPRHPHDTTPHLGATMGIAEVECHGDTLYITCPGVGAFKSVDGGRSWTPFAADYHLKQIRLDPTTPTTLYATDRERGVLKSADAGATWHIIDAVANAHVEVTADDPPTPWWTFPMEVTLKPSDDGKTLSAARDSFPSPGITVKAFTRDPDNAGNWRLVLEWHGEWAFECSDGLVNEVTGRGGLQTQCTHEWRDGASHLAVITIIKPGGETRLTHDGGRTVRTIQPPVEGRSVTGLRTDPEDPQTLYAAAGNDAFYFSTDDGQTWELLYSHESDPDQQQTRAIALVRELFHYGLDPEPASEHAKEAARIRGLLGMHVIEPGGRIVSAPANGKTLYATSEASGVLKSEDGGRTWSESNAGLTMTDVFAVACHPAEPDVVYALDDCRFYRSRDRGRSWEAIKAPPEWQRRAHRIGAILPHPADPKTVLVRKGVAVWLSQDEGTSWREVKDEKGCPPEGILFSEDERDRFYLFTTTCLVEMTNRGNRQRAFDILSDFNAHDMSHVSQRSVGIIYHLAKEQKTLWRSADRGKTWTPTRLPTDRSLGGVPVIDVHPTDPSCLIIEGTMYSADVSRNELFRSTDAGETWQHFDGVPRSYSVAFDPGDLDVFYLIHDVVHRTRDGGKTFERLDKGLPGGEIRHLAVSPVDGTVYAATDGVGIYRLEIEDAGSDEVGNE